MPKILGEKRSKEIKIRVTETELKELHSKRTKSLAAWMRDLALSAVPISQADPALVRQIARIGSNLNQIAYHANRYKVLDRSILDGINESNKLLRELIELHKN